MPAEKYRSSPMSYKRYRWDILGLAEVRWKGFGEITTDEGLKIWYCGKGPRHQYQVVFIVRKEVVGNIISCIPISSRLIAIRILSRPHNTTVFVILL